MEGWGCCRFGFFRILASKLDVWWLGEDLFILGDWFGKNTARKTRTVNYSWIEAINDRMWNVMKYATRPSHNLLQQYHAHTAESLYAVSALHKGGNKLIACRFNYAY
jgi:hypothetical protein